MTDNMNPPRGWYVCADCRGTFRSEGSDDAAHKEAKANFGVDGHAPGMVEVCDDCYKWSMQRERDIEEMAATIIRVHVSVLLFRNGTFVDVPNPTLDEAREAARGVYRLLDVVNGDADVSTMMDVH